MQTALAFVLDIIAASGFDREQYVRCSARVGDQKLSPSLWVAQIGQRMTARLLKESGMGQHGVYV